MHLVKSIKDWVKALFFALITVLVVKAFFFEVFTIPTSSMEKTLLPGDVIFVNKLNYGARTPITPLTFPLSHQKMVFNAKLKSFVKYLQLPYFRLPGISTIKRNDVTVFNYPMDTDFPIDHRSYYIKRCVALPGDTLQIRNKEIYINQQKQDYSHLTAFNYNVRMSKEINQDTLRKYEVTEGGKIDVKNSWQLTLSNKVKENLKKLDYVTSIKELQIVPNSYADYIFPYHPHFGWNIDYYGELIIPKQGVTVTLDSNNIYLYKRIIEVYEKNEFKQLNNSFVINGETTDKYTFKLNYYFMMGDNRHNSSDSRFWGVVPENHILGKATTIILSVNRSKEESQNYRWNRFFKSIN